MPDAKNEGKSHICFVYPSQMICPEQLILYDSVNLTQRTGWEIA